MPETLLTREQQAAHELGRTDVSPAVARALGGVFTVTLLVVPLLQWGLELTDYVNGNRSTARPGVIEIFDAPRVAVRVWSLDHGTPPEKLFSANAQLLTEIQGYEQRLEDRAFTTTRLLGPTRHLLARYAGWGTDDVWIGEDRWLFYRPDIDYITGPGFLDPRSLLRRRQGVDKAAPDPRPAILDFHRQLTARGIQLVLVPTPSKPMVHPGQLSGRPLPPEKCHNRSFARLRRELETAGVLVLDPTSLLVNRARQTGEPQFLATDTHWTPQGMQAVAAELASFLLEHRLVEPRPGQVRFGRQPKAAMIENRGDLLSLLNLSNAAAVIPDETVTLQRVLAEGGESWQPEPGAAVLLLGDSYTNIFSAPEMGWGASAGLAEQLAVELQQPLDQIARNADGAHATRQQLARELTADKDRLAGKRVVIWQFTVRELCSGDWPTIPLPRVEDR